MTGSLIFSSIVSAGLLLSSELHALSVTASVDTDQAALGDPVNLTVVINGEGTSLPDPILPDLSDFNVYSSGRNTSFSLQGGRSTSSQELNYTLVPRKTGTLIIGPVVVKDNRDMVSTDPIKITGLQSGSFPDVSRQGRRRPQTKTGQQRDDFFLEQAVDVRRPYVGQQVTLTFRFFQAENLWDQPTLEWPKYVGVTVEDLPPNTRSRQYIDGRLYQITEIKRALFPLASGSVTIESPKVTIKPDNFMSFDPFGLFDRGSRRSRPQVITTGPLHLDVRPLPANGKPASFSGAVGEYIIRILTDKDSVGVDEPVALRIILSGTGNIKSLPSLTTPELEDFRIYESGKTESVNQKGGRISGTKTFELALIPKTSGVFTIPSLDYSFFNPSLGKYETVATKPLEIVATGEGLTDVGGAPKNIIEAAGHSFGYIITDFPAKGKGFDISSSAWFWILQVLPVAGILTALAFRSHYRRLLGDRSYARRVSAGKRSRSIISAALVRKNAGDYVGFYENLHDAVLGYVADRLDLEKSGLTLEDLNTEVRIEPAVRERLAKFLENCQNARYSPGGFERNGVEAMLGNASELISTLKKSI